MIGIITSHQEVVSPDNADYMLFFKMLKAPGRTMESIKVPLDSRLLQNYDALLLGAPQCQLHLAECLALQKWIAKGGQLLMLSSFGGDIASDGQHSRSTNLACILKNLEFPDYLLYQENTKISVDISALVRKPATFCYDMGTIIKMSSTANHITHSLSVPSDANVVENPRVKGNSIFAKGIVSPKVNSGFLFLRLLQGKGVVCVLGSARSLKNAALLCEDNTLFLNKLFLLWLPNLIKNESRRRKDMPQRHRLLQGYPMAGMMFPLKETDKSRFGNLKDTLSLDYQRSQVIGVLPHPFCNPKIQGCGFCTFPHESYHNKRAKEVVGQVIQEIDNFANYYYELAQRHVLSVYIGGGTANLTPPDVFRKLCHKLALTFDLSHAEVTFEGVPIYFINKKPSLLQIMQEEIPARLFRVSLGIQSFNPYQIKRMGREAFGNRKKIEEVIHLAQSLGMNVSGDFLFNLPGQTFEEMQEDMRIAIDIGLDHICLYHLVMFENLGSTWSQDQKLLQQLPTNPIACEHWLSLRQLLLDAGFIQTSLTNFEHCSHHQTPRRYLYEDCWFQPERYDGLGFGPSGVSFLSNFQQKQAIKLLNCTQSTEYCQAIQKTGKGWSHFFYYGLRDMKISYLTRGIARLGIDIATYKSLFESEPQEDFCAEIQALENLGLIHLQNNSIQLTPTGMFYADTAAGLLAWHQANYYQQKQMCDGFAGGPKQKNALKHGILSRNVILDTSKG